MQVLAANLLTAVFEGPERMIREARAIEQGGEQGSGQGTARSEEWELLAAVATSLRQDVSPQPQGQWQAEIHLLRHLAGRREPQRHY